MIKKLDPAFILKAIHEATAAATAAGLAHLTKIGGDQYPCGFAWVNIKPARGQWVATMKRLSIGHTDEYGGYSILNPAIISCQNMDAKEAGARAFATVLRGYGVPITVKTRID